MKIGFDPIKDASNIAKHGISLQAAEKFDRDVAIEREDDRLDCSEVRFVALGPISDRLYVLVFMEGGGDETLSAISLRPAEKHEARYYYGNV